MDVTLARTFVAIVEAGTFLAAAKRLNVTQSTVSARVRTLETELGVSLFARSRAGAEPTEAGKRFVPYAASMVRLAEQMRQELSLPASARSAIAVGGQISLWDRLLPQWLAWMSVHAGDVAVRVEVGSVNDLVRALADGSISLAVMYEPHARGGFTSEELFVDRLVLVTADAADAGPDSAGYVFVDWGTDFAAAHAKAFSGSSPPHLFVRIGALGLQHLLTNGGSGYFPLRVAEPLIAAGQLSRVAGAPEFDRAAYMVCTTTRNDKALARAVEGLRFNAEPR